MSGTQPDHGDAETRAASDDEERRRAERRARVFGDVLPDTTSDEDDESWGDREGSSDDWLKSQVPPHHG